MAYRPPSQPKHVYERAMGVSGVRRLLALETALETAALSEAHEACCEACYMYEGWVMRLVSSGFKRQ